MPIKEFSLLPPKQDGFGDLSTNIAMLLAGSINKKPIDIANAIHKNLIEKNLDNIEEITVTTPGFINFVIKPRFYQNKIISIIKHGESYGKDHV